MFGKKKIEQGRFIIAVKDYEKTLKLMREGTISLPYDTGIYLKILDSQDSKVDNSKDLKKFIRINKKVEKEVYHSWEGLVVEGYTLINVEYPEKTPSIEKLCSREMIKYVCLA